MAILVFYIALLVFPLSSFYTMKCECCVNAACFFSNWSFFSFVRFGLMIVFDQVRYPYFLFLKQQKKLLLLPMPCLNGYASHAKRRSFSFDSWVLKYESKLVSLHCWLCCSYSLVRHCLATWSFWRRANYFCSQIYIQRACCKNLINLICSY
jgi:hypothetical protein